MAPTGVTVTELAASYPLLFHMAEAGAWPSIRRHGLLSATALVERFGGPPDLVDARRAVGAVLGRGEAVLRDNGVLDDERLDACLVDMDRRAFYRMLNGRVYLWPARHRVERLLGARAYRGRAHLVLALDTAELLARHGDGVRLSPINMGSTLFTPPPRGPETARAPADYPFADRCRLRGRADAVAEVSVEHAVPDAAELVRSAVVHHPDGRLESLL